MLVGLCVGDNVARQRILETQGMRSTEALMATLKHPMKRTCCGEMTDIVGTGVKVPAVQRPCGGIADIGWVIGEMAEVEWLSRKVL